MTTQTPPGTVPLRQLVTDPGDSDWWTIYHSGVHEQSHECGLERCQPIGFRVVDEAAFNEWLEKLKWGSTLVEWEQKRRKDEGYY